jgi:hypothetical protein
MLVASCDVLFTLFYTPTHDHYYSPPKSSAEDVVLLDYGTPLVYHERVSTSAIALIAVRMFVCSCPVPPVLHLRLLRVFRKPTLLAGDLYGMANIYTPQMEEEVPTQCISDIVVAMLAASWDVLFTQNYPYMHAHLYSPPTFSAEDFVDLTFRGRSILLRGPCPVTPTLCSVPSKSLLCLLVT